MFQKSNLNFVLILLIFNVTIVNSQWYGYSKPEQRRWARHHHLCKGKYQSPIAIYSSKSIPLIMPALETIGYHNFLPNPLVIHNNGHSVSLSIHKNATKTGERLPYIFGAKLENEYEIEGLHFHWGDKNNRGSEHVINDIRYPMEMHIIHRNMKYKDMSEALLYEDGLCVLAFFYQLTEYESPELVNLLRGITLIEEYNKSVILNTTFSLSTLLGDVNTDRFYTYRGSLTTPPCSESVRWILFPDTLPVTNTQMIKFRHLSNGIEGSVLVDNYRTLQPIGNRRVFLRKINGKSTRLAAFSNNVVDFDDWDWLF